ncbi:hypothetical protein GOP47_0015577 [Adiantum capillus-veneris]|uniref:Protein CLP1 homolog n=1 Tax=Adiantum capillus-veneris TaxID=13818 RepID=A0A9D4UJZ2_ADICA|nr:hypothetical protein GOP47_0015577 [Adiantum capillus-veneris]
MTTRWALEQQTELRIEVPWDSELRLQLVSGAAEIFGYDLPPARWLVFPPAHKFAVFSWTGATIEVDGSTDSIYTENETPMQSYLDVHHLLENKRDQAAKGASSFGPRVIVVGPTDSGKSSLSKMLLGWTSKQGRKPLFVDLDLGQNALTIPGTISAIFVDEPVDPVNGFPLEAPLVYFYGHTSPKGNPDLYKSLMTELAHSSVSQLKRHPEKQSAGMIINTMGWVNDLGYKLLLDAIDSFNADVILVLGQKELHKNLLSEFEGRLSMDIIYICKSEGVVTRDQKLRQWTRNSKMKEYFYGVSSTLLPQQNSIRFSDIHIFQFGSCVGVDPMHLSPVKISQDLVYSVLAVSYAKEPRQLLSSILAGFIYIIEVDFTSKRLWYVAPCPGRLPNNLLLKGSLLWSDQ